jgi:hypothetical protein
MNLPGAKRLTFMMPKEVADQNTEDLLIMLEGFPMPEPDESGIIQFDFVGRDISFQPIVDRIMGTPGVSVFPVF